MILLAGAACLWIAHRPLLRGLAWPLIAPERTAAVDFLCLRGSPFGPEGDRSFDVAAERWRTQPSLGILVLSRPSDRLVEAGILPDFLSLCHREMARRGVPKMAISAVQGRAADVWQEVELLGVWLDDHPEATVGIVVDRLQSRRLWGIVDRLLGSDRAERVVLVALPDRDFDDTDWWTTRKGIKAVMFDWLELAYMLLAGRTPSCRTDSTVAEYRESVGQLFGEASP